MDNQHRLKLIRKDITDILVKFHKGESLGLSVTEIMDLIARIRSLDENKLSYVLYGLRMPKLDSTPILSEEKAYEEGYNDAAEQNNFAVQIAIDSFNAINDEEK